MSIQKVIIIGNLGKEPETRYMPNGTAVSNFSVAVGEKWTKDGQQHEHTEWFNCTAFSRLAEVCAEYLHKGSQVYIEGKLKTRKWQDQQGQDRYSTDLIVNQLQMLGAKQGDGKPAQAQSPQPPRQDSDFDDDIPF